MKGGWIVLCWLAAALVGCGKERYVAKVLDKTIMPEEFQVRYQQYLTMISGRDNIQLRKQVLNNMINEILILDEMEQQGLMKDSAAVERLREIRTQAVLTGYAQRISFDTMTVGEEDVQREFQRYNTKMNARYLYAQTEEEAWSMRAEIERGATFGAMAKKVFQDPGLANNGGSLGYFGWGEMEPALEDAAFTLPIDSLSDPIKLRIGYAIVKVDHRFVMPLASESDYAKVREKLGGAAQKRKLVNILKTAANRIRTDLSPSFNEEAFKKLSEILVPSSPDIQPYSRLESAARNISSMTLVSFRQGEWTIGNFVDRMKQTTARQQKRLRTPDDLREFIIGLAVREVTLLRAQELGIERDSSVQQQIAKGTLEYTLMRWKNSVQDTIGTHGWDESLLRNIYQDKKQEYVNPAEVNVSEILVRTHGEGEKLMRQLRRGASFVALARGHSIRLWAAKQEGELGYNPTSAYGIFSDTIFSARTGTVLGPLFVDPYYGIFKILGKHPQTMKTYEEAREQIIRELEFSKKQEAVKSAAQNLQHGKNFVIDNDLLATIVLN